VTTLLAEGKAGHDLEFALQNWAKESPEAALEAFLADPRLQTASAAHSLFYALAERDPVAAMAALDRLPRKPWTAEAVKAVAGTWAAKDPLAAMQAGLALPEGARRRDFLSAGYKGWLQKDLSAAAAWIKSLPPEISPRSVIGKEHLFLGGMSTGPEAIERMNALVEVHRLAGANQNTWLHHDFMHWSSRDPEAAIPWALALPLDTPKRDDIVRTAFERIAQDQQKALALLPTLTEPKDREHLIQSIASQWATSEPEKAWAWAGALEDGSARSRALNSISQAWAGSDPEFAVAFLQQNRPEALREWGSQAASSWAATDPERALAWIQSTPPDLREHLTNQALQSIAREDPVKALDHLDLLTGNAERQNFLRNTITELARQDVTLASERVSAMPPSLDRDAAIQGLFHPAYEIEPDSALAWANSVTEPSMRESLVRNGLENWLQSDPAAAEDWWRRAAIDPALRQSLDPLVQRSLKSQ
jgi:hypothetical protein